MATMVNFMGYIFCHLYNITRQPVWGGVFHFLLTQGFKLCLCFCTEAGLVTANISLLPTIIASAVCWALSCTRLGLSCLLLSGFPSGSPVAGTVASKGQKLRVFVSVIGVDGPLASGNGCLSDSPCSAPLWPQWAHFLSFLSKAASLCGLASTAHQAVGNHLYAQKWTFQYCKF